MIDQIVAYVVAILPSVIAVVSMVCMVMKVIKQFADLRKEVKESKEMEEIKNQLQVVVQENYELKQQIKTLVNKIDKIQES